MLKLVLILTESGLSIIDAPLAANEFNVTEGQLFLNDIPLFSLSAAGDITLNAGQTYKFWMTDSSIESTDVLSVCLASDNSNYTTGVTMVGTPGTLGAYLEFAIPSDVPPIKFKWFSNGNTNYSTPTIAGSSYTTAPTGIDLEGPAANQTGTNIMDQYDHGWISIDEQLGAGERFVMDNAFFTDFLPEVMDTNNIFAIGLKGDNWVNTKEVNSQTAATTGEFFKGNTYLVGVCNSTGTSVSMSIVSNGSAGNTMLINSASLQSTVCAFLDITNSGNNIRIGMGRNGNLSVTAGDESTVTYGDWSAYKGQTGDQGYGISSLDVVMSFWTFDGGAIDGDEIDWTGLSEIAVPAAPTNATDFDKAVDFSGGNEHLKQVSNIAQVNPLRMGGYSYTVANNSNYQRNVDSSLSYPWLTSIVFKTDRNNSNQHIWNMGEGAGSTDDNIYLRHDASGNLYFGWGRGSNNNECLIAS